MCSSVFISVHQCSWARAGCKKTSSLLHYPRKIKFIHSFIHSFLLCVLIGAHLSFVCSSVLIYPLCAHQCSFILCVLISAHLSFVCSSVLISPLCAHQCSSFDLCVLISAHLSIFVCSSVLISPLCAHAACIRIVEHNLKNKIKNICLPLAL